MLEPANTKLISSHNGVAAALVCSGPDRGRAMAARICPRPRAVAHQVIGGRARSWIAGDAPSRIRGHKLGGVG